MQNRFGEQSLNACDFWRTGHSMNRSPLPQQDPTLTPADGRNDQFGIGHHPMQIHRDHASLVIHIRCYCVGLHFFIRSPSPTCPVPHLSSLQSPSHPIDTEHLTRRLVHLAVARCPTRTQEFYWVPSRVLKTTQTIPCRNCLQINPF